MRRVAAWMVYAAFGPTSLSSRCDDRDQQGELAELSEAHSDLHRKPARLVLAPQQPAEDRRLQHQHQSAEARRRESDLGQHRDRKPRAECEEEHDEEEVPQRLEGFRDERRDRAPGEGHAGDERSDLVRQPHRVAELGDPQAPADRYEEDVLPNGVEAPDERGQDPPLHDHRRRDDQRQRRHEPHRVSRRDARPGRRVQAEQQDDGDDVLEQQHADDDLAGVPVVKRGGGKQLQPDDGAREHRHRADHQRLRHGESERERHAQARDREHERAAEGDDRGLAHHPRELLRVQVETEQVEQEDDPDLADPLRRGRVLDQADTPRTDQHAERNVGDQHRLAREQREPRDDRAAGEDQENRVKDGLAVHASSSVTPLRCRRAPRDASPRTAAARRRCIPPPASTARAHRHACRRPP